MEGNRTIIEQIDGLNPNDPVEPIASWIESITEELMLVGHQPFMGRLATQLLGHHGDEPPVLFLPGSICALERNPSGAWQLIWMVRPELTRR